MNGRIDDVSANVNKQIKNYKLKANINANENILVDVQATVVDQEAKIVESLKPFLTDETKLDAILNVAGGWAGGNAASPQFLANSTLMWNQSVNSSLITASLNNSGLRTCTSMAWLSL